MLALDKAVFGKKQLEELAAIPVTQEDGTHDPFWFVDQYQPYSVEVKDMTWGDIKEAVKNSEALVQQFPVNPSKVKAIANSLFIKGEMLKELLQFAIVNGKVYILGGRNRCSAIHAFITETVSDHGMDFDGTLVRVIIRELDNLAEVKDLIVSNNESRSMPPVEKTHMGLQTEFNLTPGDISEKAFNKVLASDLKDTQKVHYLGTMFYWLSRNVKASKFRNEHNLKPETLKKIGGLYAAHLLEKEDTITQSAATYLLVFKSALSQMNEVIGDWIAERGEQGLKANVAIEYGSILEHSLEVIDRLASEGKLTQTKAAKGKKQAVASEEEEAA